MKQILIATNNQGKLREFRNYFQNSEYEILSLADIDLNIEVDETGATFFENAFIKAKTIYDLTGIPTIADDSGLVIHALSNRPGVYSARYAGENATDDENMNRVLLEMINVPDGKRHAAFVCELIYVDEHGKYIHATGQCVGAITHQQYGEDGFGYDPIFYYPPIGCTFAQMSIEQKEQISHRGEAIRRLIQKMEIYND